MDMNVNRVMFRHFGRRFSIIAGFIIGLIMIGLFNLIGENTHLFVTSMHNTSFFTQTSGVKSIVSLFIFVLPLLISGMLTTFLLTEEKRSYIFGGLAGILVVLVTMIYCYLTGVIILPASSVYVSQFGPAGILLDFIINTVPISMVGFIFGYLGGFLIENVLKFSSST
ncbi:MAG: hypothetical protein HVN34_11380 [Methanobacteriaceae archaeon]|jgi:hypothetical protein|nr:hypothetical protein [Methanobacteriaceae archaeon]